uniref:Uncharacterized protein n=1 Tax=Oryza meridionalis TaxID=40149 RepID=A0A0E0DQ51_9ORYZ
MNPAKNLTYKPQTSAAAKLAHLPPHHQERKNAAREEKIQEPEELMSSGGCRWWLCRWWPTTEVEDMGRHGGVRLHPLLHPPHVPPRHRPELVGLLRRVVGVFLCCTGASRRGASRVGGAVGEQEVKASAEHAAEMERLISQLPLFTLASSLAALLKSSRAHCRHPLLLRAISSEEGDCRLRIQGSSETM